MNHFNSTPAVDASRARRPGVPAKRTPSVVGHAHWVRPEIQSAHGEVLKDAQRELRGTFGTGQAPRGLSGMIRRRAYRIPDYRVNRWALLLLADRIEWVERGAYTGTIAAVLGGLTLAGVLGTFAVRRASRR